MKVYYIYGVSRFDLSPDFYRSCSQPLLSPTPTDLSAVSTVHDWLKALRMDRYQEEFDRAHLDTLDRVSLLTMEYVALYSKTLHTCNVRVEYVWHFVGALEW